MGRFERVTSVTRAVVSEIRREDVTFMAASIAYHAFVSMLPVLVLLILVVSAFGSERLVTTVLELTKSFLPQTGQRVVTDALRDARGGIGLSVVGVAVLLWGTSKIFRAMDAAFAEIYDTERNLSLVGQLRDVLVVSLSLAAVAVGAIVFGSVVRVPRTIPFAGLVSDLIAISGLAVAFLPIYSVFPDTGVSLREALPGVLVAAIGWLGLEWLFHFYVSVTNKPDVYGLVGTLLLLVTWLYAGSLLLLAGASVNATLAGRDGARRSKRQRNRQFGRQITDSDSFELRLDELIARADDADVPDEAIRGTLRRRAETMGDGSSQAGDVEEKRVRDDAPEGTATTSEETAATPESDSDKEGR